MKLSFFLPLLLLVSGLSVADMDSAQEGASSGGGMKRGGRGGGKRMNPSLGSKNPGTVRGSCTLAETQFNPLAGPCVNLLLIVNDTQGNEVLKTRTTVKGDFEFTADRSLAYRILSGSQYYEVVTPSGPIRGGSRVELKLRQK